MDPEAKTILVVDDNPMTARWVAFLVQRMGFSAVPAFDAEQALNALAEGQFVTVISDVEMPGMNGFELLQNVRLYYPGVPMILMTAFCDAERLEAARAGGAWALLEKPVTTDHLDALLGSGAGTRGEPEGMHDFSGVSRASETSPRPSRVLSIYDLGEPVPAAA